MNAIASYANTTNAPFIAIIIVAYIAAGLVICWFILNGYLDRKKPPRDKDDEN